jgi:uncharacterized protein YjbJ (UPF0337 family)
MDEDRVTGTARNVGGKVQEAAGKLTGDAKLQAQGAVNQAAGDIEELYGQAKDAAADVTQSVQQRRRHLDRARGLRGHRRTRRDGRRIYRTIAVGGSHTSNWTVYGHCVKNHPRAGHSATLEEAKAAFKAAIGPDAGQI